MNGRLIILQEWFKKRSARDRLYLFVCGFAFLCLIYFIFFLRPVSAQKKDLTDKISLLQTQRITIFQQLDKMNELIKSPIFLQMIAQQKRLTLQLAKMQKQLESLKPVLFSTEDLPKFTNKILNQLRNNVVLISLEELPIAPWPLKSVTDKAVIVNTIPEAYQHILQIEFTNDYFSTIYYLKRLENISSHMYWDSMEYKVVQYPKANVKIKFHVLSLQKS
jgi:MSHA biogenesis protein MshJ